MSAVFSADINNKLALANRSSYERDQGPESLSCYVPSASCTSPILPVGCIEAFCGPMVAQQVRLREATNTTPSR